MAGTVGKERTVKATNRSSTRLFAASVLCFTLVAAASEERRVVVDPNAADTFAVLPSDLRFPEGITANPANGDIYVSTFDPGAANSLLRYNKNGRLVARNDFSGPTPLLGLAFNVKDQKVYITSVGDFAGTGSRVVRIAANFNSSTSPETVADIPAVGPPSPRVVPNPDTSQDVITFGASARVPNALEFNSNGDLFVSDSFQGAVFRIDSAHACGPCPITTQAHDPLLATAGFPPFGANGLALNKAQDTLFIANTGDDRILRLNLASGVVDVFAESVNGADGVAFDEAGHLWVAANQADHVAALDENGRVLAQLGAFLGLRDNGSARGLIFPASLVIVDKDIFVTNSAIVLRGPTDVESEVTRYTIARIRIPGSLR